MPRCENCGAPLIGERRKYCSDFCAREFRDRINRNAQPERPYAFKGPGYCCWCGGKLKSPRRRWHYESEKNCLKQYWEAFRSRNSTGYWYAVQEALKRNRKKGKGYYHCDKCKEHTWEPKVDHKVPVADGGSYLDQENLQVLCEGCHNEKTKREATERAARRKVEKSKVKLSKIKTLDMFEGEKTA